ncbi:MAG: carbohydrate ABC transporter permease [Firmicutes bacterium]|nr:carbohydrate ABC transporter permease [Bacillota bacterium]
MVRVEKTFAGKVFDLCNILFLSFLSILCLYPMLYVALASVSDGTRLLAHAGLLYKPLGFTLSAYGRVFQDPMIVRGYLNTIFIVIVGVTLNMIMTAFGAYVLSRKGPLFVGVMMRLIVFTMFFSGGLIPLYLTVKALGLFNNLMSLILPNLIITYNMIILRTAFAGIPEELEDSARIDGANDFTILFRIIIPLAKPTMAVLVLYYAVHHWNAWFHAMIFIRERALYPLQLVLRDILLSYQMEAMVGSAGAADVESLSESLKYATIMVATLPILFLYPFLQRYFVRGVMIGALKG